MDEKTEGKVDVIRYKNLVNVMTNSSDANKRTAAANEIIANRLNPGIYETNISTVLRALQESDAITNRRLAHEMLKNGVLKLPDAVCVSCSRCETVYKASPLAPAKRHYRYCPWCRTARKFKSAGKEGLALLTAMHSRRKENVTDAQFLWALENRVNTLVKAENQEGTDHDGNVDEYFNKLRDNSVNKDALPGGVNKNVSGAGVFDEILEVSDNDKVNVAGYGKVKTLPVTFEGGVPCLIQDKIKWEDFNTEVCERGLLGYRLDNKWSSWSDFFTARQRDVWEFVCDNVLVSSKSVKGGLLETLTSGCKEDYYISVDSIAKYIKDVLTNYM